MSAEIQVVADKPLTIAERIKQALAGTKSEQDLKAIAASTADITAVTNKDGREQVHAAMMVLKRERTNISALCKKARDDANAFSKGVIAAERHLIALIEPEEIRLEALRDGWDAAREAERQAAIDAEQKRVTDLQERVAELRGNQMLSPSSGSKLIAGHIEDLEALSVEGLQEFEQQGLDAKAAGLVRLRQLHAAAVAHEAEQARVKADLEELGRLRKAEEERQAADRARIAKIRADIASLNGGCKTSADASPADILEQRQIYAAIQIHEGRFQDLVPEAQEVHAAGLRALDAAYDAAVRREEQKAETARLEAKRAEQEAAAETERARIAEENRRLAADKAEFQRQQEATRLAKEAEEQERAEQARLASLKRPDAAELVGVLAKHYRAPEAMVTTWLAATNWKKAKAAA